MTVQTSEPISKTAAVELIHKTLLERYGIELRTTAKGEIQPAWSADPKYPPRTDPPMTDDEEKAQPRNGRVRIIKPKTAQ